MSDTTGIQWTDSTWNVVTGCTRVSPGCARCYIERTPPFRMNRRRFVRVGDAETTGVDLHWDRITKPPRGPKVFTPSLGDLFHEEVPYNFVDSVLASMALHPDRQFQVLTKRPEQALHYFQTGKPWERVSRRMYSQYAYTGAAAKVSSRELWPLPNVWVGVSIENARYTWRADVLREIPAAVRFISAEPLLGSLYAPLRGGEPKRQEAGEPQLGTRDIGPRAMPESRVDPVGPAISSQLGPLSSSEQRQESRPLSESVPAGIAVGDDAAERGTGTRDRAPLDLTEIDWLIVGGESGPGARGMDIAWARELVDSCRTHGVAPFVKQLGSNAYEHLRPDLPDVKFACEIRDRKGGDIDEFPADLRVREFPAMRERVA